MSEPIVICDSLGRTITVEPADTMKAARMTFADPAGHDARQVFLTSAQVRELCEALTLAAWHAENSSHGKPKGAAR